MGSTVIPTMRYRDAKTMIDWLCEAFGFERHAVYETEDGRIAHAQLVYGSGMIMLGSEGESEYNKYTALPADYDGRETQSAYIMVEDIDAHYKRALDAGGEMLLPLEAQD